MPEANAPADLIAQLERTEGYLTVDPENFDLLARAIDQAIEAQLFTRAEKHVQAALTYYAQDPFMQYRQAYVLMAQGKYQEAEFIFSALTDPNIQIATNLAICQQALQNYAALAENLLRYRDDAALSAPVLHMLLRALHFLGRLEEAIEIFKSREAGIGQDAQLLSTASLLYFDMGDMENAQRYSDAALATGERPLPALLTSAHMALGHADVSKALAQFSEILTVSPQEGRSWAGVGMVSMLNNDVPQALSALQKAAELLPKHIGTWHTLAWCHLVNNDIKSAEIAFQTAFDVDRNFGESHGGLAVVAALQGDREKAQGHIARALRLDKEGLAARYAEMVLSGVTADKERFQKIAFKIMANRKSSFGGNLAEVVRRFQRQ